MAKRKSQRKKRIPRATGPCSFCENKKTPSYKEYEALSKFVTDRAKILGKDRTALCSKHQRRLSREIKRARHLGLLPFAPSL